MKPKKSSEKIKHENNEKQQNDDFITKMVTLKVDFEKFGKDLTYRRLIYNQLFLIEKAYEPITQESDEIEKAKQEQIKFQARKAVLKDVIVALQGIDGRNKIRLEDMCSGGIKNGLTKNIVEEIVKEMVSTNELALLDDGRFKIFKMI